MAKKVIRDDSKYLDPVFLKRGQRVFTYEFIELLREENLQLKAQGKRSYNLVPQKGFQERVEEADADLLVIGGKKGGGKTWIALFKALPTLMCRCTPSVSMRTT